jgi:2-hydroxychromene-2-carboxylate isomerase
MGSAVRSVLDEMVATCNHKFFDFVCPYSVLANAQLPELAGQHCAEIVYKPFRLRSPDRSGGRLRGA